MYITRDAIWRCNHTGWPESVDAVCKRSTKHRKYYEVQKADGTFEVQPVSAEVLASLEDPRYFTRVSPYVFGQEYFNVTGTYHSNILGYDETTHFYLGQYLRMMRDVFDLDLMPFYNCYAGEYTADIDFDSDCNILSTNQGLYKILSVPVKFGKQYMISLDCDQPVEMMCAVYGSKGILKKLTANLQDAVLDEAGLTSHKTYRKFQRLSFQHPVIYKTISWHQLFNSYVIRNGKIDYDANLDADQYFTMVDEKYDQGLGQFEKYLRLLIKVPQNLKSSIVVIEGDYRFCKEGAYLPKLYENSEAGLTQRDNDLNKVTASYNTSKITWTNKNSADSTINSRRLGKVVTKWNATESIDDQGNPVISYSPSVQIDESGSWVRPEIITNSVVPKKSNNQILDEEGNLKFDKDGNPIYDWAKDEAGKVQEVAAGIETPSLAQVSPLGLLQVSDGNTYAFSNRLIEFLLQHAINHLDDFGKNIQRVQEYSKSIENQVKNHSRYTGAIVPGVWDEDFQKYIFDLVKDTNYLKHKVDLTGYIDKDAETVITRGQRV